MDDFKMLSLIFIVILQFSSILCSYYIECFILEHSSDVIADETTRSSEDLDNCWTIPVPDNKYVILSFTTLEGMSNCDEAYVRIDIEETEEQYKYCGSYNSVILGKITAFSEVTVFYHASQVNHHNYYSTRRSKFQLKYELVDILCTKSDIFRCTNASCISKSQVCDGFKDCSDGKDEIGCETGLLAIPSIEGSRKNAVAWLKSKRTPSWGWRENTYRGIIALYLGTKNNFPFTDLENELMVKQLELKTSVAILRNGTDRLSPSQLGLLVNALLVTCHDPRHFYGFNIVKLLRESMYVSSKSTHPMACLALCNANDSLPTAAVDRLLNVLNSTSDYSFLRDVQAIAFMALSCMLNNSKYDHQMNKTDVLTHYAASIRQFQSLQEENGSFGNAYTTALMTQALLSGGQEMSEDWNLEASVKYLMKHLNSSSVDFLTTSLTLPILNGKSLPDIAKRDCSETRKTLGNGNSVANIENKLGLKMTVQYSLYIGDEKDVIHTISLKVPENITVYELMQLAEVADHKFRFESKQLSGKIYVYDIAGITNDPEIEKFWLMYIIASGENGKSISHYTDSPDELKLLDGDHLVMWYETTHI